MCIGAIPVFTPRAIAIISHVSVKDGTWDEELIIALDMMTRSEANA